MQIRTIKLLALAQFYCNKFATENTGYTFKGISEDQLINSKDFSLYLPANATELSNEKGLRQPYKAEYRINLKFLENVDLSQLNPATPDTINDLLNYLNETILSFGGDRRIDYIINSVVETSGSTTAKVVYDVQIILIEGTN